MMNRHAILLAMLFTFAGDGASATTYTCTKVKDKASLAYNGSDSVTDNHSDGKCTWTIGNATCTGCYEDEVNIDNMVDWQTRQQVVRGLAHGGGFRAGTLSGYFPALRALVSEKLSLDISDIDIDEIRCETSRYGRIEFNFYSPGYSGAEIACSVYEFDQYEQGISFEIGDTTVYPTSNLLVISVKGRGDEHVTMFIPVY